MQKFTILIGVIMLAITTTNATAIELIKDGKPRAKIYHSPIKLTPETQEILKSQKWYELQTGKNYRKFWKLPMPEQDRVKLLSAIDDLNYHFQNMSGCKLDVVITENPADIKTPAIVIGSLANKLGANAETETELKETFHLKSDNNMVLIGGESDMAAVYGIYEMLEQLGCDWVMPGKEGEVIPKIQTVVLPALDIQEGPSFPIHKAWYGGGVKPSRIDFRLWLLRQKTQNCMGPRVKSFHVGAHSWPRIIRKFKKEFESNPEMYALRRMPDGSMKRQGPQFETTHPRVLELAIQSIRDTFKKNNWPKDKKVCLPMGPADGGGLSESPESISADSNRIDPRSGRRDGTDLLVLFCNQILEAIGDEYPNLYLGFYLYSWHGDYPMRYKPHPRIAINVADILYSRLHGLRDKTSKSRAYYADVLDQWSKLRREQGTIMHKYNYGYNLAGGFLPFTKLKIWGEDFSAYKQYGFTGMGLNMSETWAANGPHHYLGAKLSWDVDQDWKQVLKHYCQAAFGKGGPFLEKYYLLLSQIQSECGSEAGSLFSHNLMYDDTFVAKAEELFDKATAAAQLPIEKKRISYAKVPLEFLKLYLQYRKNYSNFNFKAAKKCHDEMLKKADTAIAANEQIFAKFVRKYVVRFLQRFTNGSAKYSSSPYRIVYKVPDRLKTAIDQSMAGQNLRYFGKNINDRNYITTSTYTTTWDAQGLAGYRKGAVWYRIPFNLTKDLAGKPISLFIGGVDNKVRVWCNEKYIGSGSGYLSDPQIFDLTDSVVAGKKNLLALQVLRTSNNELGTGGLMYPSFIFTGPRLEKKAPNNKEPIRMLPGGVIVKEKKGKK